MKYDLQKNRIIKLIILFNSLFKTLINEEGVHSLLLTAAAFPDIGTYSCVARNKVGEASFSVNLNVVG
jgi:myotilin